MNEDTYRDKLTDLQLEVEELRAKLKASQTGDLISRQAAIDALREIEFSHYMEFGEYIGEDIREVRLIRAEKAQDTIEQLPSAQPEAQLSQEDATLDCISRIAVYDRVDRIVNVNHLDPELVWFTPIGVKALIAELPSAQPEQRWIPCSERLPKPFEHCLWTTTDGRVVYHHCDGLFSNYTAWMPLPEPYAERRTDDSISD